MDKITLNHLRIIFSYNYMSIITWYYVNATLSLSLSLSLSIYIYIYIYIYCLPQQPIKTLQNNGGFATENLVWNHIKWLHAHVNLPKFCDRAKWPQNYTRKRALVIALQKKNYYLNKKIVVYFHWFRITNLFIYFFENFLGRLWPKNPLI